MQQSQKLFLGQLPLNLAISMKFFSRDQVKKPDIDGIVDQELPMLFRVAVRMTLSETEAEDLVAQTLYQAAKAWDRFDGSHPKAWLISILRNEFLTSVRRKSHPTVSLQELSEPASEDYWQAVDWKILGNQILSLLDGLPEEFRLPVSLCDLEQLSREEAASSLGIPVGTLNSRLHRGRNVLRSLAIQTIGDLSPQKP